MAYDIFFVRRAPGETFEDALDETEDAFDEGEPGPLTSAEVEQWHRILRRAREILGDVEVSEDEMTRELFDGVTGIELTLLSGEVSLRVSHGEPGADAVAVMEKVYALARAVENETGLEGYDPQLGEALSDVRAGDAGALLTRPPRASADDGERGASGGGTAAPAPATVDTTVAEPAPARPEGRRWWEFWRR